MEEILKRGQLDSMYENICEEFEEAYIKAYGKSEEIILAEQAEDELINVIKGTIKDEKDLKKVMSKLIEHERRKLSEICFWNKQYYKLGMSDLYNLKEELNEYYKNSNNMCQEKNLDSIDIEIYKTFYERQKKKYLYSQKDYRTIMCDIQELENKYPRVKELFENKIFSDFTNIEKEVINDIISLKEYLFFLELKFSFDLGMKNKIKQNFK